MKWLVLPGSFLRKAVVAGACVAVCVGWQPKAWAQRSGGHVGGGVHMSAPPRPVVHPVVRAPMVRPLPPAGMPRGFAGPGSGLRHPFFFGRPIFGPHFFGYGPSVAFDSVFWLTCGPFWGWEPGCGGVATFEGYGGYPNYVLAPPYQAPVYEYGHGGPDLVRIFLKDGTAFSVGDYWFVDGQMHFVTAEEGGKPIEQVLGMDEVDWEKTREVNTRRGFRLVMRNEPWEQYLRDHPNDTPPPLQRPESR